MWTDNLIGGNIPGDVFEMKFLQSLSLAGNRLDGEIPDRFHELPFLTRLER